LKKRTKKLFCSASRGFETAPGPKDKKSFAELFFRKATAFFLIFVPFSPYFDGPRHYPGA